MAQSATSWLRRPLVTVVGTLLLTVGIVLLVLPGPGLLMVALGLGLLGSEYAWARRRMRSLRDWLRARGL